MQDRYDISIYSPSREYNDPNLYLEARIFHCKLNEEIVLFTKRRWFNIFDISYATCLYLIVVTNNKTLHYIDNLEDTCSRQITLHLPYNHIESKQYTTVFELFHNNFIMIQFTFVSPADVLDDNPNQFALSELKGVTVC